MFLRPLLLPVLSITVLLINLTSLHSRAEEEPDVEPAPEAVVPNANGVIRIEGQGQIQLKGGGMIRIQGGNLQINAAQLQGAQVDGAAVENPPWLGIQMEVRANLDLDEDEAPPPGVGVIDVIAKGPAAKAGLKAFDRVLKIDDKELKDEQDLRTTVRANKPGTTIKLRILREGKEQDLKVELEAMPAEANLGFLQGTFNGSNKPDKVHFYNLPNTATDGAAMDVVVLRDGNRLEGNLLSISGNEAILRLAAGPEVPLDLSFVQSIRLLGGARPKSLPATVQLTDGSSLAGSELAFQDGKFALNFENQQFISLPREQVSEAAASATEAPIFYRGPQQDDGWKSLPEKGWNFANEVWTKPQAQSATLSRKFSELPPAMELQFDCPVITNAGFEVWLFAPKLDNRGISAPGLVQIRWTMDTLTIGTFDGQRFYNLEPTTKLPKPDKIDLAQPLHFSIFANRANGRLAVFRNEHLLGEYTMGTVAREDFPRAGRVIQFNSNGELSLANIRVRQWAGQLPQRPAAEPLTSDQVAMENEDAKAGILTSMTSSEVHFKDQPQVPRKLPLSLRLKPGVQPAPAAPGTIYVETRQGSSFAASAIKIIDKALIATTTFAGDVSLPTIQLRLLEFRNPSAKAPGKLNQLDVLTFHDGRQLTGTFAPPIVEGRLPWSISAAKQPLQFDLSSVRSLYLAPRAESLPSLGQVIRLHNGDWFPAEVAAIDATTLTVKTAFATEWKLPRSEISSVYSQPTAKVVADGASGRKRWRETSTAGGNFATFTQDESLPQQVYSYQDGTYRLRNNGTNDGNQTGLALPLPPEANDGTSIEFTIGGTQSWTVFSLMDARGEGAFSLYASGDTMRVTRIKSGSNLGNRKMDQFQFNIPDAAAGQTTKPQRYQVVLDKATSSLHIGMNGHRLGTCKLKADDPWTEITKLVFFPTTFGNANFRLSDVWVSPWNGSLVNSALPPTDLVSLAFVNGDTTQGKLLNLSGTEAEIDTEAVGPLSLPLPRIRSIAFGGSDTLSASKYRLRLYDRGQLSGSELIFTEQGAVLTTTHGPVTIPVSMVKEIILAKAE
jgi:hypothetical protein